MKQLLSFPHFVSGGVVAELLRRSTEAAHRHLEHGLAVSGKTPSDATVRTYLAALYGWLAPVENALWSASWPEEMAAPMRACKVEWLAADLRGAGVEPRDLPRCNEALPVATPGARYGLAYVVEGSMLGGRVLAARLAERASTFAASRFLRGYAEATSSSWRAFRALLDVEVAASDRLIDARRSAVSAFASLERWLTAREVFCA
ncbi:MAG: biliverdin-producing heme oxygenase [Planctomycetota bacterium]